MILLRCVRCCLFAAGIAFGACAERTKTPVQAAVDPFPVRIDALPSPAARPSNRVGRQTLPCGDLEPSRADNLPELAGLSRFFIARAGDGAPFITMTRYWGGGPLTGQTGPAATPRKPDDYNVTWGFFRTSESWVPVGELGRSAEFEGRGVVEGRGEIVFRGFPNFTWCRPGAHVVLPAAPHAKTGKLISAQVRGALLVVSYAEEVPVPRAYEAYPRTTIVTASVDALDLSGATMSWRTIATRTFDACDEHRCRVVLVPAAAADSNDAVLVAVTCELGVGGALGPCQRSAERWGQGRWSSMQLPNSSEAYWPRAYVSREGAWVAVAQPTKAAYANYRVFRVDHASAVDEGEMPGQVFTLLGRRLVGGEPGRGPPESPYAYTFREQRDGRWVEVLRPLSADSGMEAFSWDGESVFGVSRSPSYVDPRVIRNDGREWVVDGQLEPPINH